MKHSGMPLETDHFNLLNDKARLAIYASAEVRGCYNYKEDTRCVLSPAMTIN